MLSSKESTKISEGRFPTLSEDQMDGVCNALKRIMSSGRRRRSQSRGTPTQQKAWKPPERDRILADL